MPQYIIFRIIGWILIVLLSVGASYEILNINKVRFQMTPTILLISTILNIVAIWFIYTAMQI